MAGNKKKNKTRRGSIDLVYLVLLLVLLGIGLVMMFSASYPTAYYENNGNATYYFVRQLGFAAVGLAVMYVVSLIDYRKLRPLAFPLLCVSIGLLVLVLIIGTGNYGEKRWLDLGIRFQPSEIQKLR